MQAQYLYLQYPTCLDTLRCCRARVHRQKSRQNQYPRQPQQLQVKVQHALGQLRQLLRVQRPFLTRRVLLLLLLRLLLLLATRLNLCEVRLRLRLRLLLLLRRLRGRLFLRL